MIRLCILCCFFVVSVVYAETNTPLFKLNKIMAVQKYTQSKIQFTFDVFSDSEVSASAAKPSYSTGVDGSLSADILVYPSPCPNFKCELGFRVVNGSMNNLKLVVQDMKGMTVIDYVFDVDAGYNKIDLSNLISYQPGTGMFYVVLFDSSDDVLETTKFASVSQ
jgi:hypothetical protein